MDFNTINAVKADAHSFRVTLNIIQHSECCPIDLADAIKRLETDHKWNRHAMSDDDAEIVFSDVDNKLVSVALLEWNVETERMRDWGYPTWRADHKDWWDGTATRCDCRLCGHKDNRYEFPLVNTVNGREIWTGSTCIVKYGVTVDGDGVAETALKRLRTAMGQSKKAQTRDAWRKEHPDHAKDMEDIRAAMPVANRRYIPWDVQRAVNDNGDRILPQNFDSQRRMLGKWGRAALKYYDKNGYLTPQRTEDLGEMLRAARSIVALYSEASANDPQAKRQKAAEVYWGRFRRQNPEMNDYQRRSVEYWIRKGYVLSDLFSNNRALVDEIVAANRVNNPATPTAEPEKAAKLKKLPWS